MSRIHDTSFGKSGAGKLKREATISRHKPRSKGSNGQNGDKNQPVSRHRVSKITQVFLQQEGALRAFISRFVYRPHDIEDIAQETFVRAFTAEKSKQIEYPKAYIYRIARNVALKELTRKSQLMTSYIEDCGASEVLSDEIGVDEQVHVRQKFELLKRAVADLPPQCQRVFILRKVYGYSQKEISKQLGISVSTVEKHMASGLKKCRLYMANKEKLTGIVVLKDAQKRFGENKE